MANSAPETAFLSAAEEGLIDHIRQLAQNTPQAPGSWLYPSQHHLLLALGRRFTPAHSPDDLTSMPGGICHLNAARYALAHRDEGVVYAEGFALMPAGLDHCTPHAWIVRPDGTVLDPTWDDAPGRAYVGVPIADPLLWPATEEGGLLQNHHRTFPLLREGFPPNALADLGRPLTGYGP